MESRRNRTVIITVIGGIGFTNTMLGGLAAEARLLEALQQADTVYMRKRIARSGQSLLLATLVFAAVILSATLAQE